MRRVAAGSEIAITNIRGPIDPQSTQNLLARRVAIERRLASARALRTVCAFSSTIRYGAWIDRSAAARLRAVQPITGDHDVILDGILHRAKPRGGIGQHPMERQHLLERIEFAGPPCNRTASPAS